MWESSFEQVGHVLLYEDLVVAGVGGVELGVDLPFLHQVKHVGQDGGMHRQAWGRGRETPTTRHAQLGDMDLYKW